MASQAARPVETDQAALACKPIQPLPDLMRFAKELKFRLAEGCDPDDPDERAALLEQIDAFVRSPGPELRQVLADRQQASCGRHLSDLYRQQYLAARGSIPLDPVSQAPAGICRLPANLLDAPLAIRAAALIHGLACQWLEHQAGCDRRHDRPFDCPTSECAIFGLFRRIDSPVDDLRCKPDPAAHVALTYRDRLGFVRIVSDAGEAIGPTAIAAAIDRFLGTHETFEVTWPFVSTALAKSEAVALRALLEQSPRCAEIMGRTEQALAVVEIDDRTPSGATRADLLARIQFGNGCNRWFGNLNLVVFPTDYFGVVCDHALLDGDDIIETAHALYARVADRALHAVARRPDPGSDLLSGGAPAGVRDPAFADCLGLVEQYRSRLRAHALSIIDLDVAAIDRRHTALLPVICFQLAHLNRTGRLADTYLPVSMKHYRFGRVAGARTKIAEIGTLADALRDGSAEASNRLLEACLQQWRTLVAATKLDGGVDRHLAHLATMAAQLAVDVPLLRHPRVLDRLQFPAITATILRTDRAMIDFSFPVAGACWGLSAVVGPDQVRVTAITAAGSADEITAEIGRMFDLLRTHAACLAQGI